MTIKEWLSRYLVMERKIRDVDSDIEMLLATAGSGGSGDGSPRGNATSDPTGRIASNLADLQAWRSGLRSLAFSVRAEIESVINGIEDPELSDLLFDRYLIGLSWDEITEDLGKASVVYVRGKMHAQALSEAELVLTRRGNSLAISAQR